jgi:electron transport complex protein RnfB
MIELATALAPLALLGLALGAALSLAAIRLRPTTDPVVDPIEALLPQSQCGQCGYPGCRPYAEAVAAGAAINRCAPGGNGTIRALAELLNVEPLPLDVEALPKAVAFIREAECIGCTKCIQACPVDAIVGASKRMHTVIADECTGCDLCVEPCPVDCIEMRPLATAPRWPLLATDRAGVAA